MSFNEGSSYQLSLGEMLGVGSPALGTRSLRERGRGWGPHACWVLCVNLSSFSLGEGVCAVAAVSCFARLAGYLCRVSLAA